MSDAVIISGIAVVGILIPVLGTIATLFINRWFKKMDEKLDKYHGEVNGKMGKLLETTEALGKEKGIAQEKNEQDK